MRRLAGALTTTAAALLLAGCGGGGNPEPAPLPRTTTPSPTASASASPTPPALPAAARQKTKAGAIAFARHFIAVLNYASQTGDVETTRSLSSPLCTRCKAIADGLENTYAAGGQIKGGLWHPTKLRFYAIRNDVAFVDALVDYDGQTWVKRKGAAPEKFAPSQRNLKAFNLRWTGQSGWRTSALDPDQ